MKTLRITALNFISSESKKEILKGRLLYAICELLKIK